MPYVIVERGDDWLSAYRKYRAKAWYKKLKPIHWIGIGVALSVAAALLYWYLTGEGGALADGFSLFSLGGGGAGE